MCIPIFLKKKLGTEYGAPLFDFDPFTAILGYFDLYATQALPPPPPPRFWTPPLKSMF